MKTIILSATATILFAATLHADEPRPIPAKRWQFDCHRTLKEAARGNTFNEPEVITDVFPELLPTAPVEFRYRIDRLTYDDGILTIKCLKPLGWVNDTDIQYPSMYPGLTYRVHATKEQALRIRRGSSVTVVHQLQMTTDYGGYLRDVAKTTSIVARVSAGVGKSIYFYADTNTLKVASTEFTIDHSK